MREMKKLVVLALLAAGFYLFGISESNAADTAQISVTVTLQSISISVTPTSWAIGTVIAESSHESDIYTVTNDGNVTENIAIQCEDSANWTVVGTITTTNQFKMEARGGDLGTAYTSIHTSQTLKSNLASGGTVNDLQLRFTAPQAGSNTTEQTIPVTLTATAP